MRSTCARTLLIALALPWAGCPEPPPAEPDEEEERADEYLSEELDHELDGIAERVRQRGFSPADEPWRGFLVDGATATQRLSLRSGRCVVLVAVASPQLVSLELAVHDGDGAEMVRSAAGEWGVRYCAATSGVHFVVARAEGDGLFAVRRFDGPRGLAIRFDDLRAAPTEALQPPPPPGRSATP
ncbi:MAG: hypothetical protein JJ863_19975 [Deltaproteobacteria bacterium]|nr:hypothetical protein [Deltaproteobacteria bacterium]